MTTKSLFVRITNCNFKKRGVCSMFYDEKQAIELCEEEPTRIFDLIDEGHIEILERLIERRNIDINQKNKNGDNIIMYLFKKGNYELVLKLMRKRTIDINHQNNEGNTLAHLVVTTPKDTLSIMMKKFRRLMG